MFSICIIIGKIILGFTIVSSIVVERWTTYQEKRQAKKQSHVTYPKKKNHP